MSVVATCIKSVERIKLQQVCETQDKLKQDYLWKLNILNILNENGTENIEKMANIFPLLVLYDCERDLCLYDFMWVIAGWATFVILECLIFVIDELSRIRHLIGFWNKEQFNNQSNFVFVIRQNHSGSGTK